MVPCSKDSKKIRNSAGVLFQLVFFKEVCIYSALFLICSVQPCDVGELALGGGSWSDPMPSIDGEAVALATGMMRNQRTALFQLEFLFRLALEVLISF